MNPTSPMAEKEVLDHAPDGSDLEKHDIPLEHETSRDADAPPRYERDADEALQAFAGLDGESLVIDEQTNRRLLRRIDLHLMPLMCVIYGLNYLDSESLPPSGLLLHL